MPIDIKDIWNDFVILLISTLPAALAIILGALVLRIVVSRVLHLLADRTSLTREMIAPVVRLVRTFISLAAIVLILGVFGFNLGGLWAMLATILGLIAIGFVAVWSLLSNTSSTVLILILKPFQVGDDIELAGEPVKGRVIDINFFYTTLLDEDGRYVQVPNNQFFQKTLKRRCNESTISLAFQLNNPVPADLPPPPPAPKPENEPKAPAPDPLLSIPDPGSFTPPSSRPGK